MGLPIGIALFGLGIASALVSLASNVITMPDFTTSMVAMIGLGVGIDYALFIVTRYRENLKRGASVEDSVVASIDTSGRAVLFAGITVIIALLGLLLIGLAFVQGVAIASALAVAMMIAASLTLLPALLGWVGTRIDNTTWAALIAVGLAVVGAFVGVTTGQSGIFLGGFLLAIVFFAISFAIKPLRRFVPHRAEKPKEEQVWYRWSRFIQHRPGWSALVAVGFLLLLTVPLFSIRLGFGDAGNYPEDTDRPPAPTTCSPRASGPAPTARCSSPSRATPRRIPRRSAPSSRRLNATDNVAFSLPNPITDDLALVIVYPESAPQDEATSTLVNDLRDDVIPASGVDAQGRRLHRRLDRLRRLPRGPHAVAHRRRAAAQLPVADGGVPQRARAAQGRDHEPAVHRRRLRRARRHLPMGLGHAS